MRTRFYGLLFVFILSLAIFSGSKYIFSDYTLRARIQLNNVPFIGYEHSWLEHVNLGVTNIGFPSIPGHIQTSGTPAMVYFWKSFLRSFYELFGEVFDRILYVIFIMLPFWGMYFLTLHLQKRSFRKFSVSAFVAGLIYMMSSWSLTIFHPFLYAFIFAFGVFPLVILLYYKASEAVMERENRLFYLLSGGLLLALVEQIFLHLLIIFALYVGLDIIIEFIIFNKKKFLSAIFTILTMFTVSLILNIHIFLPPLLYPLKGVSSDISYFSLPAVNFNGLNSTLLNVVRQIDYYFWFGNFDHYKSLPITWWHYTYLLFSIFSVIIFRKKKKVLFFILPLFLGIFLAKGLNPPLSTLSELIYLKIPFMQGFRDPKKFSLLIILSYAFLVGLFFEYLYFRVFKKVIKAPYLRVLSLILLFIWLYFINPFFFAGDFNLPLYKNLEPPNSYKELKDEIKKDASDFRVFPLGLPESVFEYTWYQSLDEHPGIESLYIFDKPTARVREIHPTPASRLMGFVEAAAERLKDHVFYAKLLNKLNVKYLIFDNQLQEEPLAKKNFMETVAFDERNLNGFSLFENKENDNTPFSLAERVLFVVGDYTTFESVYSLESDALDLPILWLENGKNKLEELKDIPGSVIFKDTSKTDLLASQLLGEYQLPGTESVARNYGPADYWYSYEPYVYRFIQQEGVTFLSGKSIAAEKTSSVAIPFESRKNTNYHLFIRSLYQKDGGLFEISVDGERIFLLDTNSPNQTILKWHDLGETLLSEGRHIVKLTNLESSWVVLDGIIVAPKDVVEDKRLRIEEFLKDREIIHINKDKNAPLVLESQSITENFSYKKISPCEYQIFLTHDQPVFITFKHSYDKYWELEDRPHYFVDYYANGYFIKSGNLTGTLKHEPNNIYRATFFTSMGSFILVILLQAFLLIKSLKTSIT